MPESYKEQDAETVFALDIGTRSIIGVLGKVEGERLHVFAIEKEGHDRRAMLDGQIEDIDRVAKLAQTVVRRLEEKNGVQLKRVCVAAAGRALRSERAGFTLELNEPRLIDEDTIGQLEAGAVSEADAAISSSSDLHQRLYLVGYTVSQYRLDGYPLSTLKGHTGSRLEADVVATFLPSEVVESLYAVVNRLGLEVASLTLEPIASLNAVIPSEIRLLNLVLADIGAGTSDIAICRDGSVVGYTMATIAGDEITELLMKELLVDFQTAERLKFGIDSKDTLYYTDVLGMQHEITPAALAEITEPHARLLAKEIAERIVEINGAPPSAVFLAGGGSKLAGLRGFVSESLAMNLTRVAIAGNNFEKSVFSNEYNLNDPEYATPLGIAVSAGLGLIHDSYVISLNGAPAKLFRSGTLVLRDILLMNGYTYADIIGRTGSSLMVTVDGQKLVFRGEPATPPVLTMGGKEVSLSAVVHAGDSISFKPAQSGKPAAKTLAALLGADFEGTVRVNGQVMPLSASVSSGDVILTSPAARKQGAETPAPPAEPTPLPVPTEPMPPAQALPDSGPASESMNKGFIFLNGLPLHLPAKSDGAPYYLMDLLQYSGLDFDRLERPVTLRVNGAEGKFSQLLKDNDHVVIQYEDYRSPAGE